MQGTEVTRGRSTAPVTLPFYSSGSAFGFTGFSDFDSDASHYLGARDRLILSSSHDDDVVEEVPKSLRDFVGAAVGRVRSKAGLGLDDSTAREAAEAVLRSPNPTLRTTQERLLELHHAAAKDNDDAEDHSPNSSSCSSSFSEHGNDEDVSRTEEHWNLDTGRSASNPNSSSSPLATHSLRSPFTPGSHSPSFFKSRTTATGEGDWYAGYTLDALPRCTLPPQLLSLSPTKDPFTLESYIRDVVTQQLPIRAGTDDLRNRSNKSNAEFVLQKPPKRTGTKSSAQESQLHGAMSLPPKPAVTMSPAPSPRPESRADLTQRTDAGTPIITTQSLVSGKVAEPGSIRITASSKPAPSFFPVATAPAPSAGTAAYGQHGALPPYGGGALGLHGYGGVLNNNTYSLNGAMIPGTGGYDGQGYNATATAAVPGAVAPSEFRTGDWVCISDSCSFHNFSRNTHCFGCGAAKPISCSAGPNKEPLRANVGRPEAQQQQQQQQHLQQHTQQYQQQHTAQQQQLQQQQQGQQISQQQLPTPFVQTSPSTSLSTAAQLASLGVRIGPGVNPNTAATEANPGSAVTQPPIVNTGNLGPMCVQPGDWVCSKCAFVNWRRRRVCMRCFPFAEGNEVSASLASGALIAAQLAAGIDPSPETIASLAAPPRRPSQPGSNERSYSDGNINFTAHVDGPSGTNMQGAAPVDHVDGSRRSSSQHSAIEEALQRLNLTTSNRSSLPATLGGNGVQSDGISNGTSSAPDYAGQQAMLRTRSSVGSFGQTSNTPPRFKMTASPLSPKPVQQGFASAPRPSVPLPPPMSYQQHQNGNNGPFGALGAQRRSFDHSSRHPTPPLSLSHKADQHQEHAFPKDMPSAPFVPDAGWRARDVGPIGSIPTSMTSVTANVGSNGHAQQSHSLDMRFGGEPNGYDGLRRNGDKQA